MTQTPDQQRALINHQRDRRTNHDAALDAWLGSKASNIEENRK